MLIDEIETITLNSDYTLRIDIENQRASIIKNLKKEEKIMSMLTEKRQEIANKLNVLLYDRNKKIDEKVAAYRAQLEKEPVSAEAEKLKALLKAFDEVISYEKVEVKDSSKVEDVAIKEAEIKVAPKEEVVIPEAKTISASTDYTTVATNNIAANSSQGRAGMPTIEIPDRR